MATTSQTPNKTLSGVSASISLIEMLLPLCKVYVPQSGAVFRLLNPKLQPFRVARLAKILIALNIGKVDCETLNRSKAFTITFDRRSHAQLMVEKKALQSWLKQHRTGQIKLRRADYKAPPSFGALEQAWGAFKRPLQSPQPRGKRALRT